MKLFLITMFWIVLMVAYEAWTGRSVDFVSYGFGVMVVLTTPGGRARSR